MTLTELLVVVAVMAIMLGISVPTAQHLMDSFQSSTGVRHLINGALSNARAIAVRHQAYAGVRFQEDAEGHTYMILIIHDKEETDDAQGFRAVIGRKPMKLPEDVGVISPYWIDRTKFGINSWNKLVRTQLKDGYLDDTNLVQILGAMRNRYLLDASTFSVVFSPQGKLTTHAVQCLLSSAEDTVFNITNKVESGDAMFLQDDLSNDGIGPEMSVQTFMIYSKKQYRQTIATARCSNYLDNIESDYISPYTGEIVMEYNEESP